MATSSQQPPNSNQLLFQLSSWSEPFSKWVASIAIAAYACGFLIESLHHWTYGFIDTNPFRPRVLAAGMWFIFFIAIPVTIATRYVSEDWTKVLQQSYALYVTCLFLSFPLSYLLFDLSPYAPATRPVKHPWLWLLAIVAVAFVVVAVAQSKWLPARVSAAISIAFVLAFVYFSAKETLADHKFNQQSLSLWFLAVTVFAILEVKVRSGRNLREEGEWAKPLIGVFVLLVVFAHYVYPHLKASWGGGTPVTVTVVFAKDSILHAGQSVPAQLIEESDQGFYLAGPGETIATLIPRSAVAYVHFSEKSSESKFLSGNR